MNVCRLGLHSNAPQLLLDIPWTETLQVRFGRSNAERDPHKRGFVALLLRQGNGENKHVHFLAVVTTFFTHTLGFFWGCPVLAKSPVQSSFGIGKSDSHGTLERIVVLSLRTRKVSSYPCWNLVSTTVPARGSLVCLRSLISRPRTVVDTES